MNFIIYTANCTGNKANCDYPHRVEVDSPDVLQEAVKKDRVCAEYKGNYRSKDNFVTSNAVVMDVDNDHTDEPSEFITEAKMDEMFPDIDYCLVPSRHHMLPKGSHPAAPRFHVIFPVEAIDDADAYTRAKEALYKKYPFFDRNALDAARFLFGCDVSEVTWHEAWMSIMDDLSDGDLVTGASEEDEEFDVPAHSGPILEGSRNKTLSYYAGRILKKYGLSDDRSFQVFMEYVNKCDPPLPKDEVAIIWNSATHFYTTKVMTSDGYVPPEEYNDEFGSAGMKPEDYSDIGEAKMLTREYGNTFSLEMFENIAYMIAKHVDANITDTPEEWLDGFNTFSIYQVLPQHIELWGLNVQTDVSAKKTSANRSPDDNTFIFASLRTAGD